MVIQSNTGSEMEVRGMFLDRSISLEQQIRLLREQVELLERVLDMEKRMGEKEPRFKLTVEEYHRHLEATRDKVLDDTDPTELIRQMRMKEYD
jgi:hypothetical protein